MDRAIREVLWILDAARAKQQLAGSCLPIRSSKRYEMVL